MKDIAPIPSDYIVGPSTFRELYDDPAAEHTFDAPPEDLATVELKLQAERAVIAYRARLRRRARMVLLGMAAFYAAALAAGAWVVLR